MRPLLSLAAGAVLLALASPAARAQWKTETYSLRGGWNAIWLHGDATHATPAELFKNYPAVLEVWRWNPNPDQQQFTDSPSEPDASSSEWTIWKRNDSNEQTLSALLGQSAYLVRCDGASTTTYSVPIAQRPRPPLATWLVSGANFLGFPADTSGPVFSSYFASFSVATASPAKIYKYIGGDLNSSNPLLISAGTEKLNRNTAYWFEVATVGDFTAPVHYEVPGQDGLAFGRSLSVITVGVQNRTGSALTLTLSPVNSEAAPAGQTPIAGPVPLTRRVFDSATSAYTETLLVGETTVSVPANSRLNLEFGIDRSRLGASDTAQYASLLRIRDSARFSDVHLPATAQRASAAGLWTGQVDVTSVQSQVAGSPGSTTSRSFPLRVNLHVDETGKVRLLSHVFVGTLATTGNPIGVTTRESGLLSTAKDSALRLASSQLPLDLVSLGTGTFAVGASVSHTFTIGFNHPTNPFVHTYHPDHDNRDARLNPTAARVESYDITRELTFTFTATPPDGSTITGWGVSVYGGTYTETIRGIHRNPLVVGGTFTLRRVSEVATLTIP